MKKFYRTTVSIDVLSDKPLGYWMDLDRLSYEISDGGSVGGHLRFAQKEITSKEAADACHEFGSTPTFFELDDDGNPLDRDDEVIEPEDHSPGDVLGDYDEKEMP